MYDHISLYMTGIIKNGDKKKKAGNRSSVALWVEVGRKR